jgi:hypothetical protein
VTPKTPAQEPQRLRDEPSGVGSILRDAEAQSAPPAGARDRAWRALQAPAKKGAPLLVWFAGPALAAAAIALFVFVRKPAERAFGELAIANGAVEIAGSDGGALATASGAPLPSGSVVRVGEGEATLRLGDAQAALTAGSEARVGAPGAELHLRKGQATVTAPSVSILVVAAGPYLVEAHAAVFTVRVESARTDVVVKSGAVRVRTASGIADVAAGKSWTSEPPPKPKAELPPKPPEILPSLVADPPKKKEPKLLARAPVEPPKPVAPPPEEKPAIESDEALHARALQLERAGQYREADEAYGQLAARGSARSEDALYEQARVRQRFLHDAPGALALLDDYGRRYPAGALALEASLSAIEARLSIGDDAHALPAMDAFLERFAGSERAPEVRWLRASLRAQNGHCAAAKPDLEALAAGSTRAADAVFALASCARKAGDIDGARARLLEYRRRFPDGPRRAQVDAALAPESGEAGK